MVMSFWATATLAQFLACAAADAPVEALEASSALMEAVAHAMRIHRRLLGPCFVMRPR